MKFHLTLEGVDQTDLETLQRMLAAGLGTAVKVQVAPAAATQPPPLAPDVRARIDQALAPGGPAAPTTPPVKRGPGRPRKQPAPGQNIPLAAPNPDLPPTVPDTDGIAEAPRETRPDRFADGKHLTEIEREEAKRTLKQQLIQFVEEHGEEPLQKLWNKLGVAKFSELRFEQYQTVIHELGLAS